VNDQGTPIQAESPGTVNPPPRADSFLTARDPAAIGANLSGSDPRPAISCAGPFSIRP